MSDRPSTSAAAMMDEAAGSNSRMDDDDDDDDGDRIDEATLQALANGEIPITMEACMAINAVYQEVLESFARNIEVMLAQNRDRQRSLEMDLKFYSGEGNSRKQDARVPIHMYINPYFRDKAGLAPRLNPDAIKKSNELNMLVEPAKKWTNGEKEKLSKAIGSILIEMEMSAVKIRKEDAQDRLKATSDTDEMNKLTMEIGEFDRQLDSIKTKFDLNAVSNKRYDSVDWNQISVRDFQGTRTPIECKLMWKNEANPSINQDANWGQEEIEKLTRLADEFEYQNWREIAQQLGTKRTAFQCFEKYQSECNVFKNKGPWTVEDDSELRKAVEEHRQADFIDWNQVASECEGRTKRQCEMRWRNSLAPGLKRGAWSDEEDLLLLHAVDRVGGSNWQRIAQCVPGRTPTQCRDRYSAVMTSGHRAGPWAPEEDEMLREATRSIGVGKWVQISQLVEGRHPSACKTRYRTLEKQRITGIMPTTQIESRNYDRSKRVEERRQRVIEAYKRACGGREPKLRPIKTVNANELINPFSMDIQQKLMAKLSEVRKRVAAESRMMGHHSPREGGESNRTQRLDTIWKARLQSQHQFRQPDLLRSVLSSPGAGDGGAQLDFASATPVNPNAPINTFASIIAQSPYALPPTTATLTAFRNLLSWHGADNFVGEQDLLRDAIGSSTSTVNKERSAVASRGKARIDDIDDWSTTVPPNAILTAQTTEPMRGYVEESRENNEMVSNHMEAEDDDDESNIDDLIGHDPFVQNQYEELRAVFRQMFTWPAILAMMKNE